jgi:hypothetical protein
MEDLEEEFFGKEGGAPGNDGLGKIVSEGAEIISLLDFSYLLIFVNIILVFASMDATGGLVSVHFTL